MKNSKNYKELRATLGAFIDKSMYRADKRLGIITGLVLILYILLFTIAFQYPQWPILIFSSIILGLAGSFLSTVNHDILHGSVFKSNFMAFLVCIPISLITMASPSFWKFWHNFHHQAVDRWTNSSRPYEMGFESYGYPKLRKIIGPLELLFFKALHLNIAQVKFILDNRYSGKKHLDLKQNTIFQYSLIILVKVSLFFILPIKVWLFLELIPFFIQNLISSLLLVTQHAHGLDNGNVIRTFSVKLPRILELYTLNVGYHIEHHLFPTLPSRHLPYVRKILQKNEIDFSSNHFSLQEATAQIYKSNKAEGL